MMEPSERRIRPSASDPDELRSTSLLRQPGPNLCGGGWRLGGFGVWGVVFAMWQSGTMVQPRCGAVCASWAGAKPGEDCSQSDRRLRIHRALHTICPSVGPRTRLTALELLQIHPTRNGGQKDVTCG